MIGMKVKWEKGPRRLTGRKGKNGGPVVEQLVVKILTPKGE